MPVRTIQKHPARKRRPSDVPDLWDRELGGRRLKRLRQDRDWTLQELGERAGVNESSISRIEHGTLPGVTVETLMRLCRALDCTPHYYLGLQDKP